MLLCYVIQRIAHIHRSSVYSVINAMDNWPIVKELTAGISNIVIKAILMGVHELLVMTLGCPINSLIRYIMNMVKIECITNEEQLSGWADIMKTVRHGTQLVHTVYRHNSKIQLENHGIKCTHHTT